MRMLVWAVAAMLIAPAQAQQAIVLPIAKGLWTNAGQDCAKVHYGYVYDGKRWGSLYFYGPNRNMGPSAELQPLTQTRKLSDGFTQMQFGGFDGAGYMRLKAVDASRAIYKVGAPFREEIQETEEQLVRCGFATLSPSMKAAIRKHAPGLASEGGR